MYLSLGKISSKNHKTNEKLQHDFKREIILIRKFFITENHHFDEINTVMSNVLRETR